MTNGVVSARGGRLQKLVMENRKFTNTAIPVFSGTEGWYQHIHIVQAIVKSNGWPEETAALQLFVHLKGEALNVALLLAKKERESWTGLVEGLAAYYQSPDRLAGLRRRFESAFRQPGLDPATFATDLGMLAIQTGGSTCRWEENDAPTVDRSPRVGMVNLEHVRIGGPNWVHGWDPVETHYSQKQRRRPGNERRFGRVGQPLGPLRIKAPLTLGGGVPSRLKKGCPLGRRRKMMGVAANGRWMIRNSQSWGRRRRPERSSDRPLQVV